MADRHWVGGSGTWNSTSTSNWSTTSGGASGASAPTSGDNVFYDAGSDAGSDFTVTIPTANSPSCADLTVSGLDYNVIFASSQSSFTAISIFGNFTLPNKLSTPNATWNVRAVTSFSGGGTITTNGTTLGIDGDGSIFIFSASTRTLGSDLNVEAGELTHSLGTFDTAGYDIFTTFADFIVSGTSTRTLNLNSSDINLGNGKDWDATITTNLTFNPSTSIIKLFSGNFNGGGLTYHNLECQGSNAFVNQSNTFNNLIFSRAGTGGSNFTSFSANQTVNGAISSVSTDATFRSFVNSNTLGTQRTLTCAAVSSLTDVDFRDIVIAGVAAPATGTRLGNCGNNSGITFTAAANKHWVSASSANWNSNAWATSSGGAAAANNFPLPQDTAIIDDSALTASQTVTLNAVYNYPTIDTSARTNAMTLSLSQERTIVGGLILGSGVTVSDSYFIFTNDSLQQLSGSLPRFEINGFSTGGVQLSGSAAATTQADLANGTLDLNGETLTAAFFQILGGTKNVTFNGGTIAVTGSGAVAWSNNNPTNFTTTAGSGTGTISMTSASAKTFTGGGSTYNCTLNQGGAGTLTIAGTNTFGDITNTHAGSSTISLGANQTVSDFTLSGTVGNVITFNSSSSGTRRNISKTSGTVNVTFLNIKDSNGTGGATWDAFTANGNVDGGNNLGWNFVPPTSGSNMFMLFD